MVGKGGKWWGMVWNGVEWCGIVGIIVKWWRMVWNDVEWWGLRRNGGKWCGMVWNGVECCRMMGKCGECLGNVGIIYVFVIRSIVFSKNRSFFLS